MHIFIAIIVLIETEVAHRVCHAGCSLYAHTGGKDDTKKHDIQTVGEL